MDNILKDINPVIQLLIVMATYRGTIRATMVMARI